MVSPGPIVKQKGGQGVHHISLVWQKIKVQLLRAQIIMIISQILTTVMEKHIKIIVLAVHIIMVGNSFNNSV